MKYYKDKLKLKKLRDHSSPQFKEGWIIYESSFPSNERRNLENQTKVLRITNYSFYNVYENKNLVGIITDWKFENFSFIEHLAILKELRGSGYGTRILKQYLEEKCKRVVLEVEKPKTIKAERRIKFYNGLRFKLNEYNYIQPPYDTKKKPIPMFLMTFPDKINKKEFEHIKKVIYKNVYFIKSE